MPDATSGASWEELLAAAQQGDGDAYRRFLRAILPFARNIARRHLGAEDEIEDAVQDSLLTLHRVRHTYLPGRKVKPWLAAIVSRRSIDIARRRRRISARERLDDPAFETFADPAANKDDWGDAPSRLKAMMSELSPREREAIELVRLREMSLDEAAGSSGRSAGSLKVNVHRALERLRRAAGKSGQ